MYVIGRGDHVFQCSKVSDGWSKEWRCHRLEPLKPGDKLEVGDRVAVIGRSTNRIETDDDPELGSIHRFMGFSGFGNPRIDFATRRGWVMDFEELARLPDCAQDNWCEPEDSKKETHWADDNDQPIPYVLTGLTMEAPCPHPEFEGSTWDYCGEGFKIYWENNGWIAHSIKPSEKWNPSFPVHSDPLDLVTEEDSFWRLVELAPQQSTPGKKLERPRKHGGIKTPWNPWEI